MFRSDKKLSSVLSFGLIVLICAVSLCAFAYADDKMNTSVTNVTNETKPVVVDEVTLVSLLQQSGANATQVDEIIAAAKVHVHVVNATEGANASAEEDQLDSLLTDLAINETVTKMVEDFASAQSTTVNSTSGN
jgi:hypothetical protein